LSYISLFFFVVRLFDRKSLSKSLIMVLKPRNCVKNLFTLWKVSSIVKNIFNNQYIVGNLIDSFLSSFQRVMSFY